jgi:simple sugar transport system permease protein
MTETALPRRGFADNPVSRTWRRISPRIVPVLAVISAMLLTIPFMVITGGKGDLGRGINIAFSAYSAFIEGSVGIAINNLVTPQDVAAVANFATTDNLTQRELRTLSRNVTRITTLGIPTVQGYFETIDRLDGLLDADEIDALGERIPAIQEIGPETLRAMRPLVEGLTAIPNSEATALIQRFGALEVFTDEDVAALTEIIPAAAEYSLGDLQAYMRVLFQRRSAVTVSRVLAQLDVLDSLELDAFSADANNVAAIVLLAEGTGTGTGFVNELRGVGDRLSAAGVVDQEALSAQMRLVDSMYQNGVLTSPDVGTALSTELEPFIAENLTIYRPGNQPLLIVPGSTDSSGILWNTQNTETTSDDKPDTVYFRFGGQVFLFFPFQLERMIVRSIPFIIAGLAVALAFKAGMFNIGAEGQLYAGAVLAVLVGYSPAFDFLPGFTRAIAVLIAGLIGGGLWGAIPGALKAYTGAHEVINTIMLNFIALRLVDWLINSTNPYIMRDPTASNPSTPPVDPTAALPKFDQVSIEWFIIAGLAVLAAGLYFGRDAIQKNIRAAIRPVVNGLMVTLGGIILSWLTVRGALHLGVVVMLLAVWFVNWLLNRTTIGFEIRTVGSNQNAAKYAGMNVKRNLILAMALAGALAGLAGAIEIGSVAGNMKPAFFAGLGFDAIAVALLARTNPRNMVWAGLLWGALVSAQGVIQIRTDLSNDLVKIIQALIIMFIAADVIVRYIWRVPAASEEERSSLTTLSGWGG